MKRGSSDYETGTFAMLALTGFCAVMFYGLTIIAHVRGELGIAGLMFGVALAMVWLHLLVRWDESGAW